MSYGESVTYINNTQLERPNSVNMLCVLNYNDLIVSICCVYSIRTT